MSNSKQRSNETPNTVSSVTMTWWWISRCRLDDVWLLLLLPQLLFLHRFWDNRIESNGSVVLVFRRTALITALRWMSIPYLCRWHLFTYLANKKGDIRNTLNASILVTLRTLGREAHIHVHGHMNYMKFKDFNMVQIHFHTFSPDNHK